ncbi:hypothetical protein BGZ51_003886 [Haplosporangium sp. Z 767]|nr:hypothetical protein BGZ51_003886 [Haplosporangium sp. Z 767]KAF9194943.1 hypothetical protein BGZ50_005409 [Haplosporangium sp. Z 11]
MIRIDKSVSVSELGGRTGVQIPAGNIDKEFQGQNQQHQLQHQQEHQQGQRQQQQHIQERLQEKSGTEQRTAEAAGADEDDNSPSILQ